MPVFTYRAADRTGRTIDGVMEAHDPQAVIERLHREEYFPVRVESADERPRLGGLGLSLRVGQRVPGRDLLTFTQQLSTLLDAGIPLDRALAILAELSASPRLRAIVQDVSQSVRTGSTLADALSRHHPRPFSRLYINTVRAGEKGGVLEAALRRLAEHLEASRELREALTSAMIYPALLLTVGIGAVIFLMTFVLPRFAVVFADLGQSLPLPTRILLAVSQWLVSYWWVLALTLLAALLTWQVVARSEAARLAVDRWLLGLPLVGDLLRKLEVGQFARTLGTLLHSGVPLLAALGVAREVAGNRVVAQALTAVQEGAKRGDGLARPMAETGAFPALAIHMVRVGEETGRIEDMLGRVAGAYETEIRVAVRRLISLLEPVIILMLGLIVLGIVLAILLAILSINELPL
ncbi:MAG TPA: type II secretion system F family protein [Methylomirabilota bacterium]|jgi:general secretion pathway protein F|nr:type II secretion system F family protein [Methylomirabilota bacterium]